MSDQKGLVVLKDLVNSDYVKARFAEVMGDKAPAFLASGLNATRTNPTLRDCDPQSVISSAMVAATLDLPIDGSLGFAALVPYNTKGKTVAQFQIMTKGFVQLALRSGQYKTINVGPVYEDEFDGVDIITGEVRINPVKDGQRSRVDESKIVGYVAFFRLVNGYEVTRYWTIAEIQAHGKRYSKSYNSDYGLWKNNFAAMASKTVLKNTLSKWGILSTTMQMAIKTDQAVITGIGTDQRLEYMDSPSFDSGIMRDPEEVIAVADDAVTVPAESNDVAEMWRTLMDYANDDGLPAQARKEVDAAIKRNEANPDTLKKLLAKVKTAYEKK